MREMNADAVWAALTPDRCREAMRAVFAAHARGETRAPQRVILATPGGDGTLLIMPASIEQPRAVGTKLICVMPGNAARGLPVNVGTVVMMDPDTGVALASLDGAMVTALRTAAVSALATDLLARGDAGSLLIVGGGVQARSHIEALLHVRKFTRVRVWSRRADQAAARCAEVRSAGVLPTTGGAGRSAGLRLPPTVDGGALDVAVATDLEAAVREADVICTVTASPVPLILGAHVAPGTHVNAAGAHTPATREVDTALVVRARCIVDDCAAALRESGTVLLPIGEGAITEAHVRAALGEVVIGRVPGRASGADVTLFVSLGLAIEDVAAGAVVLAEG